MSTSELNEHGRSQLALYTTVPIIEVLATLLRFWCKVKSGTGIKADDWCLLTAVGFQLAARGVSLWGLLAGSHGREVSEIVVGTLEGSASDVQELGIYFRTLFIVFLFDITTLFFIKVALCLMYRWIFSAPRYRNATLALLIVSTLWYVPTIIVGLASCIPVDYFWNRNQPGHCLNFNLFLLIDGTLETILDIAILALPIWAVSRLNMSWRNRVLVSGIFLLGGFSIITNLCRVIFSYRPQAQVVMLVDSDLWYNIHAVTAIVCASLPTYKPLGYMGVALLTTLRDRYGSSSRLLRSRRSAPRLKPEDKLRQQIDDNYGNKAYAMCDIQNGTMHPDLPSARVTSDSTGDLILRPGAGHVATYIAKNDGSMDEAEVSNGDSWKSTEVSVV
ncbi:hypothetical protein GGR58DRAFT_482994 [Xylaria digitata]|nr:hypothetical protein GGR58DRAFT_482994 [Xylaria digitata]